MTRPEINGTDTQRFGWGRLAALLLKQIKQSAAGGRPAQRQDFLKQDLGGGHLALARRVLLEQGGGLLVKRGLGLFEAGEFLGQIVVNRAEQSGGSVGTECVVSVIYDLHRVVHRPGGEGQHMAWA